VEPTYYCTGCGKPRPLVAGYLPIDERYPLVQCGRVKRPALTDLKAARRVIRERRKRRKLLRAALRPQTGGPQCPVKPPLL